MKKLLFILLIPLFLGGCYDYQELNDLKFWNVKKKTMKKHLM